MSVLQEAGQVIQLSIDSDSQRLEGFGRGMDASPAPAHPRDEKKPLPNTAPRT